MKIKIIFSFVLFLAFGVYAQKHPNDLVEVHYDNENAGGVGSSKKDLIIAAKLNADMLAPYVGHKLSAIEVYINNAPVGNTGVVQIYAAGTSTDPGDLLYSSSPVHVDSNAWNTIALSAPVTIPASDLWIGFEAMSGPSGSHSWAGCDSGPNDPDGQYVYFSDAWFKLTALGAALTYNWNIRALIEVITKVEFELPPARSELAQNYPNPFNPTTTISFSLSRNSWASLKVYNIIGQEISVLFNSSVAAGDHSINFNAAGLPGGMYIYKLSAYGIDGSTFTSVKKMLLVK